MGLSNKFVNYHHCLRNDQCRSGYCRRGKCNYPEKQHDPCEPPLQNCPDSLHCSDRSRTCVPPGYKPFSTCFTASDCKYNELCVEEKCLASVPIGKACEAINPDLCVMGSKCTVSFSKLETARCHELCSDKVPCPKGYRCTKNIWNSDPICVPIKDRPTPAPSVFFLSSDEVFQVVIIVLCVIIILLGVVYGWIRLTRSGPDPRLLSSSGRRKRKRLRLNYDGNGLATITVIPSNCQSPQPVAASQLFNTPVNGDPPAYSEVINMR